jgi:hypothetical protein
VVSVRMSVGESVRPGMRRAGDLSVRKWDWVRLVSPRFPAMGGVANGETRTISVRRGCDSQCWGLGHWNCNGAIAVTRSGKFG